MARHLKISAKARLVIRESAWRRLLAECEGHVVIGAGATLVIVPDNVPADRWTQEVCDALRNH